MLSYFTDPSFVYLLFVWLHMQQDFKNCLFRGFGAVQTELWQSSAAHVPPFEFWTLKCSDLTDFIQAEMQYQVIFPVNDVKVCSSCLQARLPGGQ